MEVEPVDPNPAAMQAYYPALVDTLRQRLGGIKVGAANQWPFGGRLEVSFLQEPKWNESIEVRAILPGFFEVLGLTPTMGRFPTDADFESKRPVAIINEAARKAMTNPELAKKLATAGLDPEPTTPEEFGKLIRSEIEKWRKVIKEAGIGKG